MIRFPSYDFIGCNHIGQPAFSVPQRTVRCYRIFDGTDYLLTQYLKST